MLLIFYHIFDFYEKDAINIQEALKLARNRMTKLQKKQQELLKKMDVEDYATRVPQDAQERMQSMVSFWCSLSLLFLGLWLGIVAPARF